MNIRIRISKSQIARTGVVPEYLSMCRKLYSMPYKTDYAPIHHSEAGWFVDGVPRHTMKKRDFKPFFVGCAQSSKPYKKPAKPFQHWLRGLLHVWWSESDRIRQETEWEENVEPIYDTTVDQLLKGFSEFLAEINLCIFEGVGEMCGRVKACFTPISTTS